MKYVDTFCKMFKVRVPVREHFDYYASHLTRSREYAELPNQIAAYERLEADGSDPKALFYATIERLRALLRESPAYARLSDPAALVPPGVEAKKLQARPEETYLLLDMRRANWSALKHHDDPVAGDLPATWEELVDHPVLALSKPLRQIVFGELSPKRTQAWQRVVLARLLHYLGNPPVAGASHDELILEMPVPGVAEALWEVAREYPTASFKVTSFTQGRIAKDMHVRRIYVDGFYDHTRLLGVPGDRYHAYFKSWVLGERPDDPRDALFTHDGAVVRWERLAQMPGLIHPAVR